MYAIVDISGKQYKVREGAKLRVASLSSDVGEIINFDNVLLTDDGKQLKIGSPSVKGAKISVTVLEHGREPKILIYKKKRRKGYQRKKGHRQGYTLLEVKKIQLPETKKKPTPQTKKTTAKKKEGNN